MSGIVTKVNGQRGVNIMKDNTAERADTDIDGIMITIRLRTF